MESQWSNLVLPELIKEQLKAACRAIREAEALQAQGIPISNILLYGLPGTGKTQIARVMAGEDGVGFIGTTSANLKSAFLGQSGQNVRQVFTQARGSAPCILFIDDLESVATDRTSPNSDSFSREIVNQMLAEIDDIQRSSARVMVVAATSRLEQVDAAVRTRFTSQIEIPLPDEAGRRQILQTLLSQRPLAPGLDADQVAAEMAKATEGQSGRDLKTVVERATQRALAHSASVGDIRLTREDLLDAWTRERVVRPAAVMPTEAKPAQTMPVLAMPAEAKPAQGATEGIPENVAGLLCYALFWISGLIFFLTDKRPFVRFHAAQSMVVFGGLNLIYFVLVRMWFASFGSLAGLLLELAQLAAAVLWVVLMVKAYQGEQFKVPVAAELTEKILAQ